MARAKKKAVEKDKPFAYTAKQKEAIELIRDDRYREIYLYGGARSAKTFTFLSEMIYRALSAPHSAHCVCRFEQVDCRKTIFEQTLEKINRVMYKGLLFGDRKEEKGKVGWKAVGTAQLHFKNGSYIAFLGVNGNANLEKILGSEWSTIFINEATEISPNTFYTLRTRLAEKAGLVNKLFLDANPPPKRHWLYRRYELGLNIETGLPLTDDTHFAKLKMNPIDNKEYIEPGYYEQMQSKDTPKAKYERFWLGEYADTLDGAVFKNELKQLDEEGRELEINIPKNAPVHAVLDIGQTTACWIVHINNRVELIDYLEVYGYGVKAMLEELTSRGHTNIKTVVLPHDARTLNHQTGSSVEEEYRAYGERYKYSTTVLPKSKWGDNINALRKWFKRFFFNSKRVSVGMDAIRNYEYSGLGTSLGELANVKPIHNWASHGADALKYVALWCGRDLEYLMDKPIPQHEIRHMQEGEWRRKYQESWNVENMIKRWTGEDYG